MARCFYLSFGSFPCVVASSSETAKEFVKTHETSFSNRPSTVAIRCLTYGAADFSFAPYGRYWKFMKKICMTELLGGRTLDHFLPVREEEMETFLKGTLRKSQANEAVDVGQELTALANNIISRTTISRRCSATSEEASEVRTLVDEVGGLSGKFNFQDYIWFCKNVDIQGLGKAFEEMFTTGTGISAGVIQWALAELINHPDILNKAREETDSTTGNKRLVKESDLPNLHFLQAIVKKTLRLHPSGPLFTRESTQHCKIGGYDIAASTRLIVNVWSIGRDPNYWENPMDFVPSRFINGSGRSQIDVRGRHYELLPFGSGRRSCPWTSLALRVIQTTLAGLIQCFDWKVANGKENSVDMTEAAGIALLMAQPLVCVPVARDIPFLTI
ncbi:cytochrome P450 93A3-like [Eucalyptus grandis]|uniref:cytochrome P450 93A3-like n=1 Tax=Eucalyptus grandis TaxID=71139 RepID=UPI00192E9992|nr:cytochrome P450 93A3-like [Eucalyptus grandis]